MKYPEEFEVCMPVIFRHEGGYINDPSDLGGETNYGICKRYFPDEDIKNLTRERAKELYYQYYFEPMHLIGIFDPLKILHIFDFGVNAGKRVAIRTAQNIVNVNADGICGPLTRSAINNAPHFVEDYKFMRKEYYRKICVRRPKNLKFLKGWINRVESTHF